MRLAAAQSPEGELYRCLRFRRDHGPNAYSKAGTSDGTRLHFRDRHGCRDAARRRTDALAWTRAAAMFGNAGGVVVGLLASLALVTKSFSLIPRASVAHAPPWQ